MSSATSQPSTPQIDAGDRCRAAEAALLESEFRFQELVEGSIQGILIHRNQQPLFVNRAWAAIHGYTVAEVMAMDTVLPLIAEHDRNRLLEYMRARFRNTPAPQRYEYQGVKRDGSIIWLENLVRPITWGGRPAIQATIIDVTDRKRAEEQLRDVHADLARKFEQRTAELRDSEALYHSLVDTISACVLRKDREGRFTFANQAFLELVGVSCEEVLGKTDFDLYPRELAQKYHDDDQRVLSTASDFEDVEQNDQEGQTRWVRVRKSPVFDARGEIVGVQALFWDVTDRMLAEEQVRMMNRELQTLLYVMSHDLKEPLRAIEAFTGFILQDSAARLDERGQGYLQHVTDGVKRMHQLLDDVLTLSRVQQMSAPRESVDAADIVAAALRELQLKIEETGAQVTVADDLPRLWTNRRWAVQAVYNLVSNSLKFTRDGVVPRVEIAGYQPRSGEPAGTGLVVRDNGPGIEARHAVRIFDLFQRAVGREIEGTGAGLAIVRQVAERHGGRAWVRTEVRTGAEVVIMFQRRDPQPNGVSGEHASC